MCQFDGASKEVLPWHGGGNCLCAVDVTHELTENNLFSLGLVEGYIYVILESHEQLMSLLHWDNRSREVARGPDTRVTLKHLPWDCLSNTSLEGWMES